MTARRWCSRLETGYSGTGMPRSFPTMDITQGDRAYRALACESSSDSETAFCPRRVCGSSNLSVDAVRPAGKSRAFGTGQGHIDIFVVWQPPCSGEDSLARGRTEAHARHEQLAAIRFNGRSDQSAQTNPLATRRRTSDSGGYASGRFPADRRAVRRSRSASTRLWMFRTMQLRVSRRRRQPRWAPIRRHLPAPT